MEFRFAQEEDTPKILQFIRELAEYEHMLDEVIATEDLLKEWIFDKKKAEVVFAMQDETEVGFAFSGLFGLFSTGCIHQSVMAREVLSQLSRIR